MHNPSSGWLYAAPSIKTVEASDINAYRDGLFWFSFKQSSSSQAEVKITQHSSENSGYGTVPGTPATNWRCQVARFLYSQRMESARVVVLKNNHRINMANLILLILATTYQRWLTLHVAEHRGRLAPMSERVVGRSFCCLSFFGLFSLGIKFSLKFSLWKWRPPQEQRKNSTCGLSG